MERARVEVARVEKVGTAKAEAMTNEVTNLTTVISVKVLLI
jgi:hypothetical protein